MNTHTLVSGDLAIALPILGIGYPVALPGYADTVSTFK